MAKQVQYRRGTTVQHSTFTGALGEITVDTTKNVVVVHDGSTTGGIPMATNAEVVALASALTSNAATQAAAINTLTTNAAVQSSAIDQLNANVVAANAVVNSVANLQNITTHIGPDTNNTRDLGFSDRKWRNLLISNLVSAGSFAFSNGTPISFNAITASITSLESNASSQALLINTINANVSAANLAIGALESNALIQSGEIFDLQANITAANAAISAIVTGSGYATVVQLDANVTAVNAVIATLDANLGTVSLDIGTLYSNAAVQSADMTAANVEIDNLRANITAANAVVLAGTDRLTSSGNLFVLEANGNVTVPGGIHFIAPANSNISLRSTGSLGNTHIEWHEGADRATVKFSGTGVEVYTTDTGVQRSWQFHPDGSTHFPQYTFPLGAGASGQYLETDGFGILSWVTPGNVVAVQANVTAANLEIGSLQSNISAANIEIGSLQSNISAANIEIGSLQSNISAANSAVSTLQSNAATQASALDTLTSNAATQATQIDLLNANVTATNLSIAGVQANVTAANLEIGSLQSNIAAANALIPNLQAVSGNIAPTANITYDLGTTSLYWRLIFGNVAFTPANATNWTTSVTTLADALDQLAQRIHNLENP